MFASTLAIFHIYNGCPADMHGFLIDILVWSYACNLFYDVVDCIADGMSLHLLLVYKPLLHSQIV